MGRVNKRRDPIIVDTVTLDEEISDVVPQYTAVTRDGKIATENEGAFGITMASGEAGHAVATCRLGFCPVRIVAASAVDGEGVQLAVGADGVLKGAGTGGAVIAISEEAATADGEQIGAWVDCLSPNRVQPA